MIASSPNSSNERIQIILTEERNEIMSSFGVSFDVDKFIQAKIMELIEPANPKNIRFTPAFESTVESKRSELHDIPDAFRNVALAYANKSGIRLTQIEIDYAADLYMGVNPWTRPSSGTNSKK